MYNFNFNIQEKTTATELSISFNRRSTHRHCCPDSRNARGSDSAFDLLDFTLSSNVSTIVFLLGNSACMSVGAIHVVWNTHRRSAETSLGPCAPDSDLQTVLPCCYWVISEKLHFSNVPFTWPAYLDEERSETRPITFCFEKRKVHLIKSCSVKYTWPLNIV